MAPSTTRGYLPGVKPDDANADAVPDPAEPIAAGTPAPGRVLPKPPAGYVPGQKRARHIRNARIAAAITVGALALSLAFVAWLFLKPREDSPLADTDRLLDTLAAEVRAHREQKGRLPSSLLDILTPDGRRDLPWDSWSHPIDYRVVDEAKGEFRLRSDGPDGKPDTPDDVVWPPGTTWR